MIKVSLAEIIEVLVYDYFIKGNPIGFVGPNDASPGTMANAEYCREIYELTCSVTLLLIYLPAHSYLVGII